MRKALLIVAGLAVCGMYFGCGLLVGLVRGEVRAYHRGVEQERAVVAPVLAADPAFARLALDPRPSGGVEVNGSLPAADLDRLRAALGRAVGEGRAREIVSPVDVLP